MGHADRAMNQTDRSIRFYNGIGVAVIAVDSYAGRGIHWEEACNLEVMIAGSRA